MESETIYLPLDAETEAVVTISIKRAARAPLDRPIRSAPTARELHHIADGLARRIYQFHPAPDI